MHRRLASTAVRASKQLSHLPTPTLAASHLPQFPPPAAVGSSFFDVSSWSAVQPPPPSALHAFAHRVGLGNILGSGKTDAHDELLTACTHPSFLPLWTAQNPNAKSGEKPRTNANLAALGNSLLGMFAAEYVNATYPHLPTRVLKAAVSAYVGPLTCASVAKEMGAVPLLRWNRTVDTPSRTGVLHADALSSVPRALTALVYSHRSLPVARKFAHAFFLNRDVDLRAMLKFTDPKKALQDTVRKFGRERPVSRLLKETGRFSNSPVFVVGIYSGADKLGEGFGSSLKMAEFRAAEDALLRLYLTRTPPEEVKLPSSTFMSDIGDVFGSEVRDEVYEAPGLGEQEVMYASAGRSAIVLDEGVREGAMLSA